VGEKKVFRSVTELLRKPTQAQAESERRGGGRGPAAKGAGSPEAAGKGVSSANPPPPGWRRKTAPEGGRPKKDRVSFHGLFLGTDSTEVRPVSVGAHR